MHRLARFLVAAMLLLPVLAACTGYRGEAAPWLNRSGASTVSTPASPGESPTVTHRYQGPPPAVLTVRRGDTVYGISRRHGVAMREVIGLNALRPPYTLHVGQRLRMPRPTAYAVQRGDTLYAIAQAHKVDVRALARVNGLGPPYLLSVGQRLLVPDRGGGTSQVAETSAGAQSPPTPVAPPPRKVNLPQGKGSKSQPSAAPTPPPRSGLEFSWPARGKVISKFGPAGNGLRNDGINIAVDTGTPVLAAEHGVVVYAGNELKGFGNLLLVKHDGGWMTAYGHNHRLLVERGDVVRRGHKIAVAGRTGNVDRPQVHFEIRRGNKAVDPLKHLERAMAAAGG